MKNICGHPTPVAVGSMQEGGTFET